MGNDEAYYRNVAALSVETKNSYLSSIRDIVFDNSIYDRFADEKAMKASLLRFASVRDVKETYPLILQGSSIGKRIAFSFISSTQLFSDVELRFEVEPDSLPPSNIHVLIGRNGVGKTRLLAGMANALTANGEANYGVAGKFNFPSLQAHKLDEFENNGEFLNLVVVSFSVFDRFDPIADGTQRSQSAIPYYYVGIKKLNPLTTSTEDNTRFIMKTRSDFIKDFESSVQNIFENQNTRKLWDKAVEIISSDPQIAELRIFRMPQGLENEFEISELVNEFDLMSSGHKIVFLTVARLVETVRDRSLVIVDEPETHLHPPLLGSFMRALSAILKEKSAVAIVATHSPVVLQEVPKKCVQIISRSGDSISISRPDDETFAENVSVLTRRIFHLELSNSGFYDLLKKETKDSTYEEVESKFDNQIGGEGRALIRALLKRD